MKDSSAASTAIISMRCRRAGGMDPQLTPTGFRHPTRNARRSRDALDAVERPALGSLRCREKGATLMTLAALMHAPLPVTAPLVLNPLMAKLVEAAGFSAGYLGGGATGYQKVAL